MPDFLGQHDYQIDAKGRVSLPSVFRRGASEEGFILLQWTETHLDLYPRKTWATVQSRLLRTRQSKPELGSYFRRITASATEVELDKQGRIRIPKRLREGAGLDGAVILIGAVDRIELWSPERFQQEMETGASEFAQFAHEIFG